MFPPTTKVLIADDTAVMRRLMKNYFEEMNFKRIVVAENGEAAWNEFEKALREKQPIQLIISDWNMPKLSGLDFLHKVRQTEGCEQLPFVMLTAETEKDKVIEAARAGVSGYITKPFTKETVSAKLKAAYNNVLARAKQKKAAS